MAPWPGAPAETAGTEAAGASDLGRRPRRAEMGTVTPSIFTCSAVTFWPGA